MIQCECHAKGDPDGFCQFSSITALWSKSGGDGLRQLCESGRNMSAENPEMQATSSNSEPEVAPPVTAGLIATPVTTSFCIGCGRSLVATASVCPGCGTRVAGIQTGSGISPKSRLVALLLCFFLGIIGVHRFYVGKIGSGIGQIVTLGGLGIWTLVDLIMIAAGSFRDIDRRKLVNWESSSA